MNKKTRNGIIAVVSIGVLLLLMKKYILNNSGSTKFNVNDLPNGGGNQGGGNQGGGNQGTSTDFYAMADELFDAFDGYGTKNGVVMDTMDRLTKQSDWNSLQNAYGRRKVSSGRGNVFVSDFMGDLKATLRNELSSNEIKKVISILSSKGITF